MVTIVTPEYLAAGNSEHGHQAALFCWSYNQDTLKQYPDLKWLFAVPNGALRHKAVAANLKAEGVKAGVPDIWLPVKRANWSGLIIELKKLPKKETHKRPEPSDEQKMWIDHLRSQGFGAMLCAGWIEAKDSIISYLGQ